MNPKGTRPLEGISGPEIDATLTMTRHADGSRLCAPCHVVCFVGTRIPVQCPASVVPSLVSEPWRVVGTARPCVYIMLFDLQAESALGALVSGVCFE